MKLPENKNERIKILAMIGIGVIAVIYAIVQLLILPVLASHNKNKHTLENKKATQETMKLELRKVTRTQSEFDAVGIQVQALSAYLVQPVLGAFLIGIQSEMDRLANGAKLQLNPASEIGFSEIPGKNKDGSKRSIKSYGTRLTGSGGYTQLLAIVRQLEENNPLLCISELTIYAQPLLPESHLISFSIEWPV